MSSISMSRSEREAFLAGTHVAILSIAEEDRGPLSVPVWYRYQPGGEVRIAIAPTSRKAKLLARTGRASLCVQTETPPYQYVMVEGRTATEPADFDLDIREMAMRYLGPKGGEVYMRTVYPEGKTSEIIVRLRPEHWGSADFRKFPMS
jgi:PPOX class probable F420-dependent enzyme